MYYIKPGDRTMNFNGDTSRIDNADEIQYNNLASGLTATNVQTAIDEVAGTAAGAGDVVGPAGATDHAVARYDTTTGKLLQDSSVIIDDSDVITGVVGLTTDTLTLNNGGNTTAITTAATASYTLQLPIGDGFSQQYLQTDGAGVLSWTTPISGAIGQPLYFNRSISSDIGGYFELDPLVSGAGETVDPYAITGTDQLLASFITPSGFPNAIKIPGGIVSLNVYCSIDSAAGTNTIKAEYYKRAAGGTETLLFTSLDSSDIDSTSSAAPDLKTINTAFTDTVILSTDRFVVKLLGTVAGSKTISINYEGTNFYSFLQSSFTGLEDIQDTLDTHLADATIHYTEASIDHTAITNIGTNSHAVLDTHVGDTATDFNHFRHTGSATNLIAGAATAGAALTTGAQSILIGNDTGNLLTDTSDNVFIGHEAGKFVAGTGVTNAQKNVYIGPQAGRGTVTTPSHDNTVIGHRAGYVMRSGTNYTTLVGAFAGTAIFNSERNTCMGFRAGDKVSTGARNTFVGDRAGDTIVGGSDNTCLGSTADTGASQSNSTAIGAGAICNANNQMVLGNATVTQIRPMSDALCDLGSASNRFGNAYIGGNLTVSGTTTTVDSENVLLADNHICLNKGYITNTAQTGGLVVNYFPTLTKTTVASGGFTAGVASTSNPTVITAGSGTFSVNDIIQISDASNDSNNGIFEVLSHTGTTLTIRGVGLTATIEDFTHNQFVNSAVVAGDITKINVSVLRTGTDGIWETGAGSATPFTFTNVGTGDTLSNATTADHSIVRYDGTNNKTIQGSSVIIDDSNNITGVVDLTTTGVFTSKDGANNMFTAINNTNNCVATVGSSTFTTGALELTSNAATIPTYTFQSTNNTLSLKRGTFGGGTIIMYYSNANGAFTFAQPVYMNTLDTEAISVLTVGAVNASKLELGASDITTELKGTLSDGTDTIRGIRVKGGASSYVFGSSSGNALTGADTYNVLIGDFTGTEIASNGFNTCIGGQAGQFNNGSTNTALGYTALRGVTASSVGDFNTAIGVGAGFAVVGSDNCTFLGHNAGNTITSGNNNTFLGYGSDGSATLANQTAIGFNATCTATNQVVIGNTDTAQFLSDGFRDLDTKSNVVLAIGKAAANKVEIGATDITTEVKGDFTMTTTIGALTLPKLTKTNRDDLTTLASGMSIYNTTTDEINYYNGASWSRIIPEPFSPLDIPNLAAWYDASVTTSITDTTGDVTAWADLSSNGFDLPNVFATPRTGDNTQNSLNVVDFLATERVYDATGLINYDLHTIILVAKCTATQSDMYASDTTTDGNVLLMKLAGTPNFRGHHWHGATSNVFDNSQVVDTNFHIFIQRVDATNISLKFSNTAIENQALSGVKSGLLKGISIGGRTGGMIGSMAEVIVFDSNLSDAHVNVIGNYLSNKWNVSWSDL